MWPLVNSSADWRAQGLQRRTHVPVSNVPRERAPCCRGMRCSQHTQRASLTAHEASIVLLGITDLHRAKLFGLKVSHRNCDHASVFLRIE